MWKMLPKYPVLPDRPRVTHHQQLPNGVWVVGDIPTESDPN